MGTSLHFCSWITWKYFCRVSCKDWGGKKNSWETSCASSHLLCTGYQTEASPSFLVSWYMVPGYPKALLVSTFSKTKKSQVNAEFRFLFTKSPWAPFCFAPRWHQINLVWPSKLPTLKSFVVKGLFFPRNPPVEVNMFYVYIYIYYVYDIYIYIWYIYTYIYIYIYTLYMHQRAFGCGFWGSATWRWGIPSARLALCLFRAWWLKVKRTTDLVSYYWWKKSCTTWDV